MKLEAMIIIVISLTTMIPLELLLPLFYWTWVVEEDSLDTLDTKDPSLYNHPNYIAKNVNDGEAWCLLNC